MSKLSDGVIENYLACTGDGINGGIGKIKPTERNNPETTRLEKKSNFEEAVPGSEQ